MKVCNLEQVKCAVLIEIKSMAKKITTIVVDPINRYLHFSYRLHFSYFRLSNQIIISFIIYNHIVKLICGVKKYRERKYNITMLVKILFTTNSISSKIYHLMLQISILVSNHLARTRQANCWNISDRLNGHQLEEDHLLEYECRKWNGDRLYKIQIILVG